MLGALRQLLRRLRPKLDTPAARAERAFLQAAAGLGAADIAIDCGANVGRYTEVLARSGARVYAFEPNPDAFTELRRRMSAYSNVVCLNQAVAAQGGRVCLYLHENAASDPLHWSTGSSLLAIKGNVDRNCYVEVEAVDFVDFLRALAAPVALVKMDIEGAEVALLEHLLDQPQALAAVGRLFAETHEHKIPELRAATGRLRERIRRDGLAQINLDWQ